MEQSQLLKQILNTPNGIKMYREIGTLGNVSKDHLNQALYAFTDNRILKRSKLNFDAMDLLKEGLNFASRNKPAYTLFDETEQRLVLGFELVKDRVLYLPLEGVLKYDDSVFEVERDTLTTKYLIDAALLDHNGVTTLLSKLTNVIYYFKYCSKKQPVDCIGLAKDGAFLCFVSDFFNSVSPVATQEKWGIKEASFASYQAERGATFLNTEPIDDNFYFATVSGVHRIHVGVLKHAFETGFKVLGDDFNLSSNHDLNLFLFSLLSQIVNLSGQITEVNKSPWSSSFIAVEPSTQKTTIVTVTEHHPISRETMVKVIHDEVPEYLKTTAPEVGIYKGYINKTSCGKITE